MGPIPGEIGSVQEAKKEAKQYYAAVHSWLSFKLSPQNQSMEEIANKRPSTKVLHFKRQSLVGCKIPRNCMRGCVSARCQVPITMVLLP